MNIREHLKDIYIVFGIIVMIIAGFGAFLGSIQVDMLVQRNDELRKAIETRLAEYANSGSQRQTEIDDLRFQVRHLVNLWTSKSRKGRTN